MEKQKYIIEGIAGDIIGSVYEWHNVKTTDFELFYPKSGFTDDSVLTLATMNAIINQYDYAKAYRKLGRKYPHRGCGRHFRSRIYDDNPLPYNSWGNGSAMRVSPVIWYAENIGQALSKAKQSAEGYAQSY